MNPLNTKLFILAVHALILEDVLSSRKPVHAHLFEHKKIFQEKQHALIFEHEIILT